MTVQQRRDYITEGRARYERWADSLIADEEGKRLYADSTEMVRKHYPTASFLFAWSSNLASARAARRGRWLVVAHHPAPIRPTRTRRMHRSPSDVSTCVLPRVVPGLMLSSATPRRRRAGRRRQARTGRAAPGDRQGDRPGEWHRPNRQAGGRARR